MFPNDVLFLVYSCGYFYHLNKQAETKILRGPHEDLESYLGAIDQLKGNIQFFSSKKCFRSCDAVINNSNNLLTKAISKLEDEFKQRLLSYRFVFSCSLMLLHCASSSSASINKQCLSVTFGEFSISSSSFQWHLFLSDFYFR